MMPPTTTITSSILFCLSRSITRGTIALCAPERIESPDDVHVFLHSSTHNHFWRLTQAGVDDLHAGVTQSAGNNLCAPVMPVEARLCDQYADFLLSGHFLRRVSTRFNTERSRIQQRQEDRPIR